MSMKSPIDTIGNRTRDLPTSSAVPEPTTLPLSQVYLLLVLESDAYKVNSSTALEHQAHCPIRIRASSSAIVNGLRVGRPRNRDLIHGEGNIVPGAHPVSCYMRIGSFLPRDEASGE